MKRKHEYILRFLNDGEDEFVIENSSTSSINLRLEDLKRLKFDDQKWEIDASRFIIHGLSF